MSARRRAAVVGGALAGLCLLECGAGLRTVEMGPHPATAPAPLVVAEPAPTNKVETIPKDPGEPCAWLDGRWEWLDRPWEWKPGAWVMPPGGCHFAPPETRWVPSTAGGLLFYFPGRWYPDAEHSTCSAPRTCGGAAASTP